MTATHLHKSVPVPAFGKRILPLVALALPLAASLSLSPPKIAAQTVFPNQAPQAEQPVHSPPFIEYARGYSEAGQFDKAIAMLDSALKFEPRSEVVFYRRGMVYYFMKNYPAALSDFGSAIGINPNDPDAHNGLGLVYVGQGRDADALASFEKAAQLNPQHGVFFNNIGFVNLKIGHYAEALANFDKAIQLDPRNDMAFLHRGWANYYLRDTASAASDFSAALGINPNNREARAALENLGQMRK